MRNIVLQVNNLTKTYRIGEYGTGTLSQDLNRWMNKASGRLELNQKVTVTGKKPTKNAFVNALTDIDFSVKSGEVIGVVGKNGAGKSTLLKILSKVTKPTSGNIKIKGKIAALLEVGTGFHPELTGRENVFLNGAILGMSKSEIKSKLEAIVDFAGVEQYLDTPVKRYSSGMTVRLGFAVAAHLEPEILIVDEVLAVGDAEFQKKAIGKMQEASQDQGRTVLVVSHNLATINELCNKSLLLQSGRQLGFGDTKHILTQYLQSFSQDNDLSSLEYNNDFAKLHKFSFQSENPIFNVESQFTLCFEFCLKVNIPKLLVRIDLISAQGIIIVRHDFKAWEQSHSKEGKVYLDIPKRFLNSGLYNMDIKFIEYQLKTLVHAKNAFQFEILPTSEFAYSDIRDKNVGAVISPINVRIE